MSKPVILTVDDEPEVLNAVERDLRRHFRGEYRIVKANSGREALEAVQRLKERGIAVALFLVDERMPEMTGTAFLEQARHLYPEAKKALLTAYADTEAAITAINVIGLDHYLLKPWDPPEQRLYPVLDDLLSDWHAGAPSDYDGIRVVGTRWSRAAHETKEFLSQNQVPYRWVDIEEDPGMQALLGSLSEGGPRLPAVLFPDGSHLFQPTQRELADKVGLQTRVKLPFYDVVIVGAGPAGLAAAVYAASEGLRTMLVEKNAPGGQAGTSSQIENYLGFPSGITGGDLARRAVMQAKRFGAEIITPLEVTSIRREDPYRVIRCSDGTEIRAFAVIITSGVSVRQLDVPGAEELIGAGVYYGAAMTEAATYRGKEVVVVGAANSAGQGAMFFSRYARKVFILARGDSLARSMSSYLVERIAATENIETHTHTRVLSVVGKERLERIVVENALLSEQKQLDADAMFIFIGAQPHTDIVAGLVERDDKGYILTGRDLVRTASHKATWPLARDPYLFETSVPGIFAAGDVRHGSGKRVAAAVGEGSATVSMVHSYLETV